MFFGFRGVLMQVNVSCNFCICPLLMIMLEGVGVCSGMLYSGMIVGAFFWPQSGQENGGFQEAVGSGFWCFRISRFLHEVVWWNKHM